MPRQRCLRWRRGRSVAGIRTFPVATEHGPQIFNLMSEYSAARLLVSMRNAG